MKKKKSFSVDKRPWHRQFIKSIVILCNLVVALGMLIGGLTLWIEPEYISYVSCFGLLFPVFLLLNILFVLFWMFMRDAWFLVSLSIILLLLVPVKNTLAINRSREDVLSTTPFSVLTYNTLFFNHFSPHSSSKPNAILQYISEQNPDVVCLQEFGVAKIKGHIQMKDIDASLSNYKYRHVEYTINNSRKSIGVATFSKYPIVRKQNLWIDSRYNVAISSDIVIDGDTVRVFNCHLESNKFTAHDAQVQSELVHDFDTKRAGVFAESIVKKLADAYRLRAKQARQVAAAVAESPYPVLLCGDFNDVPTSYTYNTIKTSRGMQDAFVESGNGLGFTYQRNPINVRIDYIMYDDYFCALECDVDKKKYSDHYPVHCLIYKKPNK